MGRDDKIKELMRGGAGDDEHDTSQVWERVKLLEGQVQMMAKENQGLEEKLMRAGGGKKKSKDE